MFNKLFTFCIPCIFLPAGEALCTILQLGEYK
jgi:hypothetical protein